MDGQEDDQHEGQHQDVQRVPAEKGVGADLDSSEEHEADLVTKNGCVPHHVRSHRDRPESQLVPGQQVTGEGEQQGQGQQDHADHPVELSGRLVGAVVEHPGHVEEHGDHHEVCTPPVHVAHEQTEPDRRLEGLDVGPGLRGSRTVEEHQEDAGHGEEDEQEEAQPAEAEGVTDLHGVPFHLHRVQVVEDAVHDHVGPVPGVVAVSLAEDRAGPEDGRPGLRALHLLTNLAHSLLQGLTGWLPAVRVCHLLGAPSDPHRFFASGHRSTSVASRSHSRRRRCAGGRHPRGVLPPVDP